METKRYNPGGMRSARIGFTLVELLVVITIIGILVALITVAASAALKKGRQTAIKVELDQISMAFEDYKGVVGSYPPNLQVDGTTGTDAPIDESQVLADVKRHFKQAFPRSREPDDLIARLAGLTKDGALLPTNQGLQGGMTAGEALVFWLSGFSSDPKYPISGEGGPSYDITSVASSDQAKADPVENRHWTYPFEVARLEPRDPDGYFDESDGRFIEYQVTIPGQNNNQPQTRRINFWQYVPRNSKQPYLYFDTSRHPASVITSSGVVGPYDPPAATELTGLGPEGLHVHAIKKINPTWTTANAGSVAPIVFVNPDKFQILQAGIDDEWGVEEAFERMTVHAVNSTDPGDYLLYPDGPFTADVADTIVNFTTGTLEDSQP
jgi:prepilin-type N-terminal cleavage/methylation domain-containing protein